MTDETKKYLVQVESNLPKYAAEAVEAKKKVDELREANKLLKESGTATAVEIEKNNAALRTAEQEYKLAKKSVDLATAANNAEKGSYQELYKLWQLAQTQLKLVGGAYEKNAQGVLVLSQRHMEAKVAVDNAKKGLDAFGKSVSDNRLNVGSYSEAIDGALGKLSAMPGPFGAAAQGAAGLGKQLWALVANPIIAIIAGITLVLVGLFNVFKSTADGANKLKEVMASVHAILNVLRDRVIGVIQALKDLFHGDFKKAAEDMREVFTGIGDAIGKAAKAAAEYARMQIELDKTMAFHISEEAQENNLVQKYIFLSKDKSKADQERLEYLKEALQIGMDKAQQEVDFAKQQFDIDVKNAALKAQIDEKSLSDFIKMNDMQQGLALETSDKLQKAFNKLGGTPAIKLLEEGYAKAIDADTEFYSRNKRNMSQYQALVAEMAADRKKILDDKAAEVKKAEEEMASAKKRLEKELDDFRINMLERHKAEREENEKKKEEAIKLEEWKAERDLINHENAMAITAANNEWEFTTQRNALRVREEAEIDSAKKSGADVNLIKAKYAAAQQKIDRLEADAKLGLYSDFAGNIATIFGKNTAIGKAAAVAQATISTYQSAVSSYAALAAVPIVGPALGFAAAAAAVVAGIANVKQILSVKSGLPGDTGGGSAPTAIAASPAAARAFAQPVGSSLITQKQLSQTELNALPNQGMISSTELSEALKNMPPPIVTVEDINLKADAKRKVEVKATI